MTGVLDGITVLQLPSGIAGAMAGMLLADNGADVITVEGGDHGPIWCRTVWDRGKRSIVADDDQVRALAAGVDVVIESQGLDHATLAATNPGGFKGMGEGGAIGSPPAVINAVADAIAHLGARVNRQPLSPGAIIAPIEEATRS